MNAAKLSTEIIPTHLAGVLNRFSRASALTEWLRTDIEFYINRVYILHLLLRFDFCLHAFHHSRFVSFHALLWSFIENMQVLLENNFRSQEIE